MSEERMKELLNQIVDWTLVENSQKESAKMCLDMGFTKEELINEFMILPSNFEE